MSVKHVKVPPGSNKEAAGWWRSKTRWREKQSRMRRSHVTEEGLRMPSASEKLQTSTKAKASEVEE